MNLDAFFDRTYNIKRYNCLHHATEVWHHLTNEDISAKLAGVLNGVTRAHVSGFRRLPAPVDPCLVLMRHAGSKTMHVGVWRDRRVIHITERGVECMPLDVVTLGFTDVRYYR